MRQLRFLFAAGVVLFGPILTTEAQQPTLPANPSTPIEPPVSEPAAPASVQGTLQTTTVQSTRPPYDPNQKVTPDEYYSKIGTTGSYRVNTDRAKEYQDMALQRARQQNEIKEQMSSTRHFRTTQDSPTAMEFLKSNPPHPNPAPLAEQDSEAPPSAPAPPSGTMPPEDPNEYIKMKGSGGSLADRIMAIKSRSTPEVTTPTFSETELPPVAEDMPQGPPPGSNVPLPPTNVFRPGALNQNTGNELNTTDREKPKTGLLSWLGKDKLSHPEAEVPPAEPTATANLVTGPPSEPAYPAATVSTFAAMDNESDLVNSPASEALVAPPERKSLFSLFGKKRNVDPLPEVSSPASPPVTIPVPPPSFQPYEPAPPKPEATSIFRPNASAKKANAFSIITGDEVYARVEGEDLKLSPGTRVRVLREGTDRSLVRLYDNRQATVPNKALAPEAQ